VEPHSADALRTRRAEQQIVRNRRRRRRLAGLLACLLGLTGGALLLTTNSPRPLRRRDRVAASAPALALAARRARAEAARARAAALAAQILATRRLAVIGRPLYCGGRRQRVVALTFDDGPGVYTRLALKKLREYHLRATFFLVGKEIRAFPRLIGLEKPVAAFGDHTMTHPFLPGLLRAAMAHEIRRAKTLIERVTGEPVVLFRPPYEGRTPAIDHEVRALGMVEVLWNVDSRDSLGAGYREIERNVLAGLRPGSIILMHENHGQTIRAMPTIFGALKRARLKAVTVPELIAEDPPSPAQLHAGVAGCGPVRRIGNGG
jgi:peptidoglycan/xylan/chitin deacetylase (PgdA/CDA1 family)